MRTLLCFGLLCALVLCAGQVEAQAFTRGEWAQRGNSLASAFWRATGGERFLDGTALTAGVTMMESEGAGGGLDGLYAYAGGGAFDSDRQEWVYCCTTGDAYNGTNEVVAISVTTGGWTRQMDPTVSLFVPARTPWPSSKYAAGNLFGPSYLIDADNAYPDHVTPSNVGGIHAYPNSRQDYGCHVYMPSVRKFFLLGGFAYHSPNGGANYIFEWTPATKRWQLIDSEGPIWNFQQLACAWDPDRQRVLISSGYQLRAYNPVGTPGSRISTLIEDNFTSDNDPGHMFYDAKRHRALKLGYSLSSTKGRYYDFDGTGAVIVGVNHPFEVSGSAVGYGQWMGPMVFHDPVIDQYVYFHGSQTLTFIDPATFIGTDQTFPGATPLGPGPLGGYHKWFYNAANDTYNAAAPTVTGPGLFVFAPVRPQIAFMDLIDGPTGTIVTAWGTNLGTVQGTVTVGGVPASTVYYWGNATPPACGPANLYNGYQNLQCVIFQVAGATPNGSNDVVVTVGGVRTPPATFTVRPGRILFVCGSGCDFNSLNAAMSNIEDTSTPLPYYGPPGGEIVYVKNGMDAPGGVRLPHQPKSPVAFVVYPGHSVHVGDPTHTGFDAAYAGSGYGVNLIFSKFIAYQGNGGDGERGAIVVGTNGRAVGNLIQAPRQFEGRTACVGINGNNASFLGNEVAFCNDPANRAFGVDGPLYHVIYLNGQRNGSGALERDRFVQWNYIHDNGAARAINNYNANTIGDNPITGLRVEHNVIINQTWAGIALLGGTVGENWVTDNLVINAGRPGPDGNVTGRLVCIELNPFWPVGVTPTMSSTIHVSGNTLVNCGRDGAFYLNTNTTWFDIHDNTIGTGSTPPPPPAGFALGSSVQTTTPLNVRATPNGTPKIPAQPQGATGVIEEGPVVLFGQEWYRIKYRTGNSGWSVRSKGPDTYLIPAPPAPVADHQFTVPRGQTYSINGGPILVAP